MIYCFDIDGTICRTSDANYLNSVPFPDRIDRVNELFENGHEIIFFTARGSTTGIDWSDQTERQLKEWGVKFHRLILGKPQADLFIDDLAVNSEHFDWGAKSAESV